MTMKIPFFLCLLSILLISNICAQNDYYINTTEGKKNFKVGVDYILIQYKKDVSLQKQNLSKDESLVINSESLKAIQNTHLVKLKKEVNVKEIQPILERFKQNPIVEYVSPELKYEDGTSFFLQRKLLVQLKDKSDLVTLRQKATEYHLIIEKENKFTPNLFHLSTTEKTPQNTLIIANRLHELDIFDYAAPDFLRKLNRHSVNDPLVGIQWALNNTGNNLAEYNVNSISDSDMDVYEAWRISTGSPSITVAVIDDGVDLNHPDLQQNLVIGYDATQQGSQGGSTEGDAHGTAAAGLIAAVGNNNIGIAGVAYNCKIMPVRIFNRDNIVSDSRVADAINWAWQNGADVLNNSWGGGPYSPIYHAAIRNAVAHGRNGKGCLVLFATGNENSIVSFPARNREVIAVGATSPCDERKRSSQTVSQQALDKGVRPDPLGVSCDEQHDWGSNHGTELDIAAPGPWTASTDVVGNGGYTEGDYTLFSGTSAACPNAAGVAALILSVNPNLTSTQARAILEGTCDKVGGYNYTDNVAGQPNGSWSNDLGYGRVNAHRAVYEALRTVQPIVYLYDKIEPNPNPVAQGQGFSVKYNVANDGLPFSGDFSIDLLSANGDYLFELDRIENASLCSNCFYSNGLTFNVSFHTFNPGSYQLMAFHRLNGNWSPLRSGRFNNPFSPFNITSGSSECPSTQSFNANPISNGFYQAGVINSAGKIINTSGSNNVTFKAEISVNLLVGFEVEKGANFSAIIGNCDGQNLADAIPNTVTKLNAHTDKNGKIDLVIYPNPVTNKGTIEVDLPSEDKINITLYDTKGKIIKQILQTDNAPSGMQQLTFDVSDLSSGVYFVSLISNNQKVIKKLIVTE